MSTFAVKFGLGLVLAALCLSARAQAQSAPLTYWTPGWPLGFAGNPAAGEGANIYGNFPSFGQDFSYSRYNFSNGLFVGSERSAVSLNMSGINQARAFGSLYGEGVQFGYNFKNAPVAVYAGFDTLKYNGLGSALAPFDSTSTTVSGYSAHAGVAFQPTSNLSFSFGVGYTQQPGRVYTDTPSPSLSNNSQFDLVGGRR